VTSTTKTTTTQTSTTKTTTTKTTTNATTTKATTTTVTEGNYGLAESQIIFARYKENIAKATKTDGMGVFMHNKKGADSKDRTIMRINFDTLYSFAIVDLNEEATLTMPETHGRYQTAWLITEEHYNPFALTSAGAYTLSKDNVGCRYCMIGMRTQVNVADPDDIAAANALQEQLILTQNDRGSYVASNTWDLSEVLAMRATYEQLTKDKGITTSVMFGKKGEVTLENHNAGAAVGWGGFTADQADYLFTYPTTTAAQTLTLTGVPVNAFWSVTIYDEEGFPQGDVYNINSAFANADSDGSVTIHFGGDKTVTNYMDTFEGWNYTLRLYQPNEEYLKGNWTQPALELVQ